MMLKCTIRILIIGLIFCSRHAFAQGTTAFTYQGQLHDGGTNANGNYAMIFALYDAPGNGNQIGVSTNNLVTLANGLFTVNLDFGFGAFDGTARWLEIRVGNTNGGNFVTSSETLSPRVPVLPVPYALYASTAGSAGNLTNSSWNAKVGNYQSYNNVFGIYASNTLVMGLSPNGVLVNGNMQAGHLNATGLNLSGDFNLGTNFIQFNNGNNGGASLSYDGQNGITVGGNLNINSMLHLGTGNGNFGDNGAGNLYFDGQSSIRTDNNIIVSNLTLTGNAIQFPSRSGSTPTVNTNGDFVFHNNFHITPLGALGFPGNATISGITGGLLVQGTVQFDNTVTVFGNTYCNNGSFYGDLQGSGSGIWTGTVIGTLIGNVNQNSDRNLKEKFTPIDAREVLEQVAALPISVWNYKQDLDTRHIGPMAQDFYAAFNVGTDDKHIATVDEGGVALAAIQGLNEKLKTKDAEIQALEKRLDDLEQWVKAFAQK